VRLFVPAAVVLALGWLACGESLPTSDAVEAPTRDSGVDAVSDAGESGPHEPTCYGAPFETAVPLPELSSDGDEQSVTLSVDELEVFVGTTRDKPTTDATNYDIWTARRGKIGDPFGALVRVDAISSDLADYASTLTPEGIIFSSQRQTSPSAPQRMYYAPRIALSPAFDATVTALDLKVDATASDVAPFLASDNVLYFSRGTPDAYRIMRAKRTGLTTFDAPEDVAELNEGGGDTFAVVVSNDGKTIYFGTDGRPGTALTDIFVATRASASGPFSTPVRVDDPVLNTPQDERPGFLSTDGCRLYFVSNRPGGPGASGLKDVWLATRVPK